jgi:uncharacterized protein (DUF2147 family)
MIRELPAYEIAQIRFAAMQPCFEDSMASRFGFIIAILTALLGAPTAKAQAGPDPTGIWLTQAGDAKVRVQQMRRRNLRGRDLAERSDQSRHRKTTGRRQESQSVARQTSNDRASLFGAMQHSGPNKWSGQIYNADDGNSYASNISVSDPDTLRVEGCVGVLCGGENWTRSAR